MSYNGSGTFNINSAGQPVVTGTVISSTAFNALTADLATGLSTCITKDGQTTVTANIPMNSFKFTGLAAGTASTDSVRLGQLQAGGSTLVTVSGTDVYTGTMSPALTGYAAGNTFTFVVPNTNTTSCTLNIDGQGAKAITRDGSTALVAGDLVANSEVVVVYDGTRFQVLNSNSKTNFNLSGNLTVAGSITATGGTANGVLYLNGSKVATSGSALTFDGTNFATTGTSSATKFIPTGGAATGNGMYLPATNTLAWSTNGAEKMRLDASGNLGLGVTPSAWSGVGGVLQVGTSAAIIGNSVNSSSFISNAYYDGSNYRYIGSGYAARFALTSGIYSWNTAPSGTAGNTISFTQAMTLDASGNLAIGGTTNKITGVSGGGSGFTVQAVGAPTLAIWDTTDTSYYTNFTQVNEVSYIWNIANGAMIFGTNNTERARITSGGYFKASNSGTYLGSTGSYHELRQDADGLNIAILSNYSGTNAVGIRVYYASYSPNGTGNLFLNCDDAGGARFQVRSNGGLANYSANDVNLSDRREKTNFAPAKDYLDTICAIPVQTFNYIDQSEDDPGLTLGVVAQDVQAVAPELVMESNWGTEENPKMRLSIYQTDLQYALMKCIQEQQVMINELKAEVAALKGA